MHISMKGLEDNRPYQWVRIHEFQSFQPILILKSKCNPRKQVTCPSRAAMASFSSVSLAIVTKPNPRDLPVSLSYTTLASMTLPCSLKSCSRRALSTCHGKLPTYTLKEGAYVLGILSGWEPLGAALFTVNSLPFISWSMVRRQINRRNYKISLQEFYIGGNTSIRIKIKNLTY